MSTSVIKITNEKFYHHEVSNLPQIAMVLKMVFLFHSAAFSRVFSYFD